MERDLSVSAGTTGFALHVATPLNDRLSLRLGASLLDHDKSERTRSVDYDFQLKLRTVDMLLDFYPTDRGFRLTGGLMFNGNRIDAAGLPNASGSYVINNRRYSASEAGRLDGRIDFRNLAPYLGVGWGKAPQAERGWGVALDVGAMLQGRPRVALATSGCTLPQPMCAQLAEDVSVERASLSDKVDNFRVYPVIRAGVTYRF
ncbi:hypothetical protein KTQ42_10265|uniref:hypothetical protein n=1 Tax=Noviherbaspirillum sp. L7-7A TaxID=2850560 RepID=UPI001C2C2A57|nr:hypothetical protein [Noviherbaspirillum sp. L7-7A]MBV0879684.1 hypothetical protein [Noviherbaspirillum sp. L7-7A]